MNSTIFSTYLYTCFCSHTSWLSTLFTLCLHLIAGSGAADLTKDQCNKTVDIFEDVSSPEVNSLNVGRPLTCWYRFRTLKGAPRDFVLRLRFKKFKVGTLQNATHCEGGYLQVSVERGEANGNY